MTMKQNQKISIGQLYQVGDLIDAKDNQGDWRVGYIIEKMEMNKIFKVRFDGWGSKYDELYGFANHKLRQFRSFVVGYTGQKQNPAIRPSWKFSLAQLQNKLVDLSMYINNKKQTALTPHQFNQWIRGHNYLYVDFLMTTTFTKLQQINKVIQFFKINIYFCVKFLENITKNLPEFLSAIERRDQPYLDDLESAKWFAFYQIFDTIFTITGSYQRLQGFFKQNDQLLREYLKLPPNNEAKFNYQVNIIRYLQKLQGFTIINNLLKELQQQKRSLPFMFLYSLAHLNLGVSCVLQSKSKEAPLKYFKKITQQEVNKLEDKQLKDINCQQILDLIGEVAATSQKTALERQIEEWALKLQMEVYFKMITCPYFEKKLKGITSLQQFIELKSQILFVNSTITKWIQQKKLFQILFSNDNPQIIKKSTELIKYLFTKDDTMQKYITLLWKYRQGKHETAMKQIYNFMGELPLYDKNQQFTITLFKKQLSKVQQKQRDADYIKMIKQYTVNALSSWMAAGTQLKVKETLGFDIIYDYLQRNQSDPTLQAYLIQILQKLCNSQFFNKFVVSCFNNVSKKINASFHISLLLRILRQKIGDLRNQTLDVRSILQSHIIQSKNQQKENLHEQFQLFNETLKLIKQIIPQQEFIHFWIEMIDSKARAYFFKWLYKISYTGKINITNYINKQTKEELFKKCWTVQYLTHYQNYFDELEATFLLQLFKTINFNADKIKRANVVIEIVDEELIGLQKLHLTYEMCKDQKAQQILAKGLAEIYMSESDTLILEDDNNNFMKKFINSISQNLIKYSLQKNIVGIKKMILLIQQIILRDQEIFDVNYYCRNVALKDYVVKNLDTNQDKIIRNNAFQCIYNFKKLVADKFGFVLHKFDLLSSDQQVIKQQDYFKPIGELDIKGKIFILIREGQASNAKKELNHRLELLFELLGNKQIEEKVWNIVAKLPISHELSERILTSNSPLEALESQSFYKQLYMFKVALSIQKKWWGTDATEIINFFLKKLQKTSLNSQIQREYMMVTIKIIERIVSTSSIPVKFFSETFTTIYHIMKKVLFETNKLESLNPYYIKKFFQSSFVIGDLFNKFLQSSELQKTQTDSLGLILSDKQASEFLKIGLISYRHEAIRKQFPIKMMRLSSFSKERNAEKLSSLLFNQLLDYSLEVEIKNLREYTTFSSIVLESKSVYLESFYKENKNKLFIKLFSLIQKQPAEENCDTINLSLYCYLSLMRYAIQQVSNDQLETLFDYIYQECLFKENLSKCKSKETRNAVISLLLKLIKYKKNQEQIMKRFGKLHREGLWRSRKLQDWTITQGDRLKSSTGYTGLRNLGCICYMNSFLQQIFMIQEFRDSLLLCQDPTFNQLQTDDNLLYQVKKMFLHLLYSDKKAYNPKSFCMAFKDYQGNPTNVSQQMDIDQFSGILFDRLQNAMKGTLHKNLVKDTFGGIFSNQIICKGCPHFSETEQSFLSLSLTVKDKKSVYESLQTMIKGDTLDGDNAYHCQRCDKKVSAVKRVCLKSLPDYLIVTLKRFQFDYNTMQKLKINQYCQFPHQINLEQYSYEHLRKKQNPKAFQGEQQALKQRSKKYYEYRLKGVVIHLGYADSGHYYSLIQERSGQQRWLQFNDTIVRKFNKQNLNDEAFGGETGGVQSKEKIKNAYMLIYERIQKINSHKDEVMREKGKIKSTEMYSQIFQTIKRENSEYNIESILFSGEYNRWLTGLIDECGKSRDNIQLQKFVIMAFLTVLIRSKIEPGTYELLQKIWQTFGNNNPKLSQWILYQFCDVKIFDEFLRNCPLKQTKRLIAMWVIQLLKQSMNKELNIKFMKLIIQKVSSEGENTVESLTILHHLIDEMNYVLELLLENNIIGKLLENILPIKKQLKVYSKTNLLDDLIQAHLEENQNQSIPVNQLGYEQVIEKTAFEQKKFKYDNEGGIVWAIINKIMKRYNKKQLQTQILVGKSKRELDLLYLPKEKIYKLLEQMKSKFDIDVFTDCLAYLSFQNPEFSQMLSNYIERGLKEFQSKRYRQFFILFQKLISICDSNQNERVTWIHGIIRSLKENEKYAMDCTIIQLWICKLVHEHENLRQYLMKEKTVLQYLHSIPTKKVPSDELSKKNSVFLQSSISKLHGIPFPTSRKGYFKILKHMQQFYQKLMKGSFEPVSYFQSGNHCAYDKLAIQDKVAYFDSKDKMEFEQATIKSIFLDKLLLERKSPPNTPAKQLFVWVDDQKLTSNLKVVKQDHDHELDSSKTTEMEDEIDFQNVS